MSSLPIRQDKFVREYVKTGNGSLAARKAGYTDNPDSAKVTASRLLTNVNVSAEIKAHRRRLQERLDISRETLINNAAHIAEQASVEGQYAPAIKATELILKAQGYLVERQLNLSVDVTQSHLDALQAYTDQRVQQAVTKAMQGHAEGSRGSHASSFTDVDAEPTQDNCADRSMDVMSNATDVDDTTSAPHANPLMQNEETPQDQPAAEAPRMR